MTIINLMLRAPYALSWVKEDHKPVIDYWLKDMSDKTRRILLDATDLEEAKKEAHEELRKRRL